MVAKQAKIGNRIMQKVILSVGLMLLASFILFSAIMASKQPKKIYMQSIGCSASVACPKGTCFDGTKYTTYTKYACINSQCLMLPYLLDLCPTNNLTAGLKGYWQFDEGAGNKTKNSVNKFLGQIWFNNQSDASWKKPSLPWIYGIKDFNKSAALGFNGSRSYANLGSITDVSTNQITISFWLKLSKSPSEMADPLKQPVKYPTVVSKDGSYNIYFGTAAGWGATSPNKDKLIVKYFDAATSSAAHDAFNVSSYTFNTTTADALNTWHYIVWSFDGKISTLYIDGKIDNQKAIPQPIKSTTNNLIVGSSLDGGAIDELKVYWYALSRSQVFQKIPSGEVISFGDYESPTDDSYCGDDLNEYVTTQGTGGPKCCAFKNSTLTNGVCVHNDGRSNSKYLQLQMSVSTSTGSLKFNTVTSQTFNSATAQFKDSVDEIDGTFTTVISNDTSNVVYGAWRTDLSNLYTMVDPAPSCFDTQGNIDPTKCDLTPQETLNLPCYTGATTLRILDDTDKELFTKDIRSKCN